MVILTHESMKNHTSFRTGGAADLVALPETEKELITALCEYPDAFVLGNGTNTLVKDKGIRGSVVITSGVKGLLEEGGVIRASCGESLTALSAFACKNSLSGLEFLYGIPGTVGGGVYMNAGAYGREIQNVFKSARLFSPKTGLVTAGRGDMEFAYRGSALRKSGLVALSVEFQLEKGEKAGIQAKMDTYMASRKAKQPLEYPSAGSTFKRPAGFYAGKLIEEAGLKGFSVGGARVSEKHAGFVINHHGATSADILNLIAKVKQTVFRKTGVVLEEEIQIIGE